MENPQVKSLGSCLGFSEPKPPGPLSPGTQRDFPPNTQTSQRVPKWVLAELPKYETGKDTD